MLEQCNKELRLGAINLHSTRTPFYKKEWFKQHAIAVGIMLGFMLVLFAPYLLING